jgi:hypothetical protein
MTKGKAGMGKRASFIILNGSNYSILLLTSFATCGKATAGLGEDTEGFQQGRSGEVFEHARHRDASIQRRVDNLVQRHCSPQPT